MDNGNADLADGNGFGGFYFLFFWIRLYPLNPCHQRIYPPLIY